MTPHFNRNPLDIVAEAERAGAKTDSEIVGARRRAAQGARSCALRSTIPMPRRTGRGCGSSGAATRSQSSAKGHEFFLRHYLGTHDNAIAEDRAKGKTRTVQYRDPAPRGKFDLVVDINFRMDTSALYSDIVLPTAFWYEKNDLNSTDLHSFIHMLGAAVPPVWESKTDWEIFKLLAQEGQRTGAARVFQAGARRGRSAAHARHA